MGAVYRARDPAINRVVAIKSISLAGQPPEAQAEYRERFLREAEAAGRLSHRGIVTIFDVGEEPETHAPYIVMEYVKGKSLEHSGKLAARVGVTLVREVADALECAHSQGVIHRDLKPSNILLTEDGHAKIADFGVARLNLSELTATGQILGTPAFMSPEQLNGEPVDERSDLFSLGVILYTLLTGHRPFQGNSVITVSFKVVHHDPVPPEAFNLTLPPGLNEIVVRAMAKDPRQRYQSAKEMALDLQRILEQPELWEVNKEPAAAPTGLFELTDRVYAKHSRGDEAPGSWLAQKLERFKTIGAPVLKSLTARVLALLSILAAAGAFVIWLSLRPPLEAAPSPPSASSSRSKTVSGPRAAAQPSAGRPSQTRTVPLRISVNPKFSDASLTVWVDNQRVLHKQLDAAAKKKFGLFGHGGAQPSESIYVAPGEHQLRVNVQSPAQAYDESHSLTGTFPEGSERLLSVTFSSDNEMKVRLK